MATLALTRPAMAAHASAPDVANAITPPHSISNKNKHQPNASPVGLTAPKATRTPACTPPPSPSKPYVAEQLSLLYPPDAYSRLDAAALPVYELDADQVANALDFAARQPLPPPCCVFPWLHGLHPDNQLQQAFFAGHSSSISATPVCLRGVCLVKAQDQLDVACLKGTIASSDFMRSGPPAEFVNVDPPDGFSVRNFYIQPAKMAFTSDIIVYHPHSVDEACKLASHVATAQSRWRQQHAAQGRNLPCFNTFVCTSPFSDFEQRHANLVSVDASGTRTGSLLNFSHQERKEMCYMAETSQISHNVFMGPTPEPGGSDEESFDVLVECSDMGRLNPSAIRSLVEDPKSESLGRISLDFPSSGSILPPAWSNEEAEGIIETCRWLFHIAHGTCPDASRCNDLSESHSPDTLRVRKPRPRKILIHCTDGYTESTMLGIAYLSFSAGIPVPQAWLKLHTCKRRDFFAYPTDVALLTAIAPRLLHESPTCTDRNLLEITDMAKNVPKWLPGLDGSLPSRILSYLYLGNLGHANNPHLLADLGIRQVLSVGETASWSDADVDDWGADNICVVHGVQDNGIDSLTDHFDRCLEFINRGRRNGTATLVHCRVGVSRSATICIAEVMRCLNLSFPRAYCFVRARRLNVIIQPHLRFVYELLRWEEHLRQNSASYTFEKREMEWGEIAREITLINRPYSR